MFKQRTIGVALLAAFLLIALGAGIAQAQGGEEDTYQIDWCVVWNAQRAIAGQDVPSELRPIVDELNALQPGEYEYTVPQIGGSIRLEALLAGDLSGLTVNQRTIRLEIHDRGVNCVTGDAPGVVRLWDDKHTLVIFRDPNYDVSFYFTNGRPIHTTPYWMLIGPFEAGQLIDEHRTIGGTLRLYYLHDNYFQANWYGPDGALALQIPFTYPQPCPPANGDDESPGAPRICR